MRFGFAINAGIDMAMVPLDRDFCVYLRELVEEGLVSERRIDDAVRRILRLKMRIGLFEEPFPDTSKFDRFASDEFAAVALQAAEESDGAAQERIGGLLPLPKSMHADPAHRPQCQFHALSQRRLVLHLAG